MLCAPTGQSTSRALALQEQWHGAVASAREHMLLLWAWLSRHSNTLTRLHLALFYFYGVYYVWPKRVTGAVPERVFFGCPNCLAPLCAGFAWTVRNLTFHTADGSIDVRAMQSQIVGFKLIYACCNASWELVCWFWRHENLVLCLLYFLWQW